MDLLTVTAGRKGHSSGGQLGQLRGTMNHSGAKKHFFNSHALN